LSLQVIEKAPRDTPPIYNLPQPGHPIPDNSPFRKFIAIPNDTVLLLAPRRVPPVACPAANTDQSISILTSVGFRRLESEDYVEATRKLLPDIVVGIADVASGKGTGKKRIEKMGDRTSVWTRELVDGLIADPDGNADEQMVANSASEARKISHPAVFAPILPIERGEQAYYLEELSENMIEKISGLAVYDSSVTVDLPEGFATLPRLSLDEPANPHSVLREISLGIDIFVLPFVGEATDAGISLDFSFPSPTDVSQGHSPQRPLGINMWDVGHARDISPLREGCRCYACRKHHRAYIQHLLAAKEMLGWVLLQIHNLAIMDEFFSAIRASIARGTFDVDMNTFEHAYERELPEQTGQGPR
jgi:queuine tRNA-ribosyltransferase accessory subunit